ncbi:Protein of unknown function [Desulfurobacterium pacificum]|jgi:hypothetical protein|uniref:Inner membrane protein YgaP-like transmembrane domain-containing protein n=1 Tax=Desulfurobacterium pacificum TaxID=240166 RepID=A0ABY1NK82_9BACT|nr:DUF2892 domain-containing protein [Desulfurobacterium pacificum]SMP11259.1 Protein of unknown function [Desulfurobacterium pacificum]
MAIFRAKTDSWYVERITTFMAGFFTFTSTILGLITGIKGFFYFTAFIGFMLMFYAITGLCPSSILLHKLGVPSLCDRYCKEEK